MRSSYYKFIKITRLYKIRYITRSIRNIHTFTRMDDARIYRGIRGDEFKQFISGLLARGKITPKYMDILTNDNSMKEYDKVFTAKEVDSNDNYEIYEKLGDPTANKFIVWYMYRRFPQLDCAEGVSVIARLLINYGAKASFARLGDDLGFWPFITQTIEKREVSKKTLVEDCFEAFIGCTEYLLDKNTRMGVGYAVVYDILASIFDKEDISLKYEDLYDPITRLKEVFDFFNKKGSTNKLGAYTIITTKNPTNQINSSTVYLARGKREAVPDNGPNDTLLPKSSWEVLGRGMAASKSDSQQKAAEQAIRNLRSMGFSKEEPEKYRLFCQV